jgi:hypothetical protein
MLINPGQKSIRFKVDLYKDFYGKKFWSKVSSETYERIRTEILKRVECICKTRLNGRNTIQAINELADEVEEIKKRLK